MLIKYDFSYYGYINILNRLSIYWCKYMQELDTEYWLGFYRRKVFSIGRFTFWIRS